jgi:hypothetical protein
MEAHIAARRIGPIGTTVRAALGSALLVFAVVWGVEPLDVALGLVVLPGAMVTFGLIAERVLGHPLRFTGPGGIAVNCAAIVVLFAVPNTTVAAALFYGVSLLVAAWRGAPHCEATVLSNLILRRDDQIGCPTMTPLDAWEARSVRSRSRSQA